MLKIICTSLVLLCSSLAVRAELDTLKKRIDISRVRYHENIEKEQRLALQFNNGSGTNVNVSGNSAINAFVTHALVDRVNELKDSIENEATLNHRLKVKYLSGLENMLKGLNAGWRSRTFNPVLTAELVRNYRELMYADIKNEDISPIVQQSLYEVGNININSNASAMYENPGYSMARQILFRKFCEKNPDQILSMLEQYYDVYFADSLVKAAAHRNPNQLYDYAAAFKTNVGRLIRRNSDPLVKTIAAITLKISSRVILSCISSSRKG